MSTFDDMMRTASAMLGTKYVWGGNDPNAGVDCSGFTRLVYASIGIELPRVSNQQANYGTKISQDQAQPGDLVWWDLNGRNQGADHVGIYLGNGKVMEASSSRGEVVVRNLWGNAQFSRVSGAPTGAPVDGVVTAPATGGQPMPEAQPQRRSGQAAMASLSQGGALNLGALDGAAPTAEEPPVDSDPFDLEQLYALADPNDTGEGEDTVGPYNVARLMLERFEQPTGPQRPTREVV